MTTSLIDETKTMIVFPGDIDELGSNVIEFISDPEYDGQYLNTQVRMNGIFICWIAFDQIHNFLADLAAFLGKYRFYKSL